MDHVEECISIVVPMLNESECLPILHQELREVVDALPYEFEFIFVDDGSTDQTFEVIERLRHADPRVHGIRLTRNFGHQAALCAGLERARGDAIVMMDCDLQHPPRLIPELLNQYQAGHDVVNTCRLSTEREPRLKKLLSNSFYRFFNWAAAIQIEPGAADFRLVSRQVLDQLNGLPEVRRFLRGLVPWLGFPQTVVTFDAPQRRAGVSKYNFRRSARLALEGLTSFSFHPLRKSAMVGGLIALCAFLYGIAAVATHLFTNSTVPGWTSLFTMLVLLNGFQFMMLGILGEYVGRILEQVQGRPMYIVREDTTLARHRRSQPTLTWPRQRVA